MAALFTGNRPPRIHLDRDRIPVRGGGRVSTEVITITNDGGGVLKGSAITNVNWIRIPNPRIETPFITSFRIEINPNRLFAENSQKGTVTIISNGGSAQILVEYIAHPQPRPTISLDETQFQFCNLQKGANFSFDLIIRNSGSGVLNGTIESESDWIVIKTRTIWTRSIQAVPVTIRTSAAPAVSQPTGRIRIRSSGGSLEVPISINFRRGAGPVLRLSSKQIRCIWDKRGIIEETLTIYNDGVGTLRGTIPSPVPWLKIIPSIFPVQTNTKILFRIDTRMLTAEGTLSIPIQIITNAGNQSLNLEVTPVKRTISPVRKTRVPARYLTRTRLMVYDPEGSVCTLLSTGRAGGEGEIYILAGDETRCAKIFHPHRRTLEIEEKIRTMISSPPDADLLKSLTWPLIPVTDLPRGGRVIGYLMRRIPEETFKSVHLWYDEAQTSDKQTLLFRIIVSLRLATIVAGVHKAGHVIGDLRENNLLINEHGDLILIDTDSLQIREKKGGRVFWSRVGTGEYLPPEHLDGSFAKDGCDRRQGDHFALAVLIFKFLMDGVHPFQAKGPLVRNAPATTDKILLGYFAFEIKVNGISPPDYAPPYDRIPPPVQALFREAFITGYRCPSARPDAARWVSVLSTLIPHTRSNSIPQEIPSNQDIQTEVKHATDEYSDNEGNQIHRGRILFRTEPGIIAVGRSDAQIFLLNSGMTPIRRENRVVPGIPPSLVIPLGSLFQGNNRHVGWTIPPIDPDRYFPWHMLADPESRVQSMRSGFSFNRRIACCRNLMAALISAERLGIADINLSERSVFIGPDASVRILCIPLVQRGRSGYPEGVSPAVLIFRMLMEGYHPFHAVGERAFGTGSHERRMASGLYPWVDEDPGLRPPPGAPSISRLPDRLIELFKQEFRDQEGKLPGVSGYTIWFETLDQIYQELICCSLDPDHWYLPGLSGCPWCNQRTEEETLAILPKIIHHVPSEGVILLIGTRNVSGLLMERTGLRRNRIPTQSSVSPWRTIPLPPKRVNSRLFLDFLMLLTLPPESEEHNLPMVMKHQSVACILVKRRSPARPRDRTIPKIPLNKDTRDHDDLLGSILPELNDISLIDEMIWVSTMDRLRGEGIGQPKIPRGSKTRQVSRRRRPIQIMLLPITLPIPEEEWDQPENSNQNNQSSRRKTSKKSIGKRIRGRLQTILRDFIRGDPDQNRESSGPR